MHLAHLHSSPFIGRQEELAEITSRFERGARLVTVTGLAGVGKSRLVTEWVRYSGWTATVVQPEVSNGPWVPQVRHAVETPGLRLLWIDGRSRELEQQTALFERWLLEFPNIHVLWTSSQPLHWPFEHVIVVQPLPISDAHTLLSDRARSIDVPLDKVAHNARELDAIVARLDGLPTAVEWAARRLVAVAPQTLRLQLEAGAHLDWFDTRQPDRTLRAILGQSLANLPVRLSRALELISTFDGPFPTSGAQALLEESPDSWLILEDLVQRGLLHRTRQPGGKLWFSLRHLVRDWVLDSLTPAERAAIVQKHADFFLHQTEALRSVDGFAAFMLSGSLVQPFVHRNLVAAASRPELTPRQQADLRLVLPRLLYQANVTQAFAIHNFARKTLSPDDTLSHAQHGLFQLFSDVHCGVESQEWLNAALDASDYALAAMIITGMAVGEAIESPSGRSDSMQAIAIARRSGQPSVIALCARYPNTKIKEATVTPGIMHPTAKAHWWYHRAKRLIENGNPRAAVHALQVADELRGNDERTMSSTLGQLHCAIALGNFASARAHLEQAACSTVRSPLDTLRVALAKTALSLAEGRYDDAQHSLSAAQPLEVPSDLRFGHTLMRAYLRLAQHQPHAVLAIATDAIEEQSVERRLTELRALRGWAYAQLGYPTRSREDFSASELDKWVAFGVEEGHTAKLLELGARIAWGDMEAADLARKRLRHLPQTQPVFMRVALHALQRAVGELTPNPTTLHVEPGFRALRVDEGSPIDLVRRPMLQRLVAALVRTHRTAPGRAVPVDRLIAAGWPEDRASRRSLVNRLHVALSKLRRSGLRPLLERVPRGYRLVPGTILIEREH